jgi:hypothetical protein
VSRSVSGSAEQERREGNLVGRSDPREPMTADLQETAMNDDREHITKTEARAGTTVPKTRYILGWSIGLIVVAFVILLIIGWR